jgi:hypothetical protein
MVVKIMKKNNTPLTFNTLRKGKAPEVRMVDVSASAPKSLNLFPKKTRTRGREGRRGRLHVHGDRQGLARLHGHGN